MRALISVCFTLVVCGCGAGGPTSSSGGGSGGGDAATGGGTAGGSAGGTANGGGTAGSGGGTAGGSGGSGGGSATGGGTAATSDAGIALCPTTGQGALIIDAGCFTFTPAEAGADSSGVNATQKHYALEPASTPRGQLLLFFNGSLGHPINQVGDGTQGFYAAAAHAGLHVIALSYESDQVIGLSCSTDPCFAAARKSVILGVGQPGAPTSVASIRPDEGIVQRTEAALLLLAARRPGQGWDQFLTAGATPEARIVWSKVTASGHSQGGGHSAYLGKLFALHRVIQLSSTCDAVGTTPAAWTSDGVWATPPATAFYGFGTPGDTLCAHHVAIWQAMGMDASRQLDTAQTCGGNTHGGSVGCVANYPVWLTLF